MPCGHLFLYGRERNWSFPRYLHLREHFGFSDLKSPSENRIIVFAQIHMEVAWWPWSYRYSADSITIQIVKTAILLARPAIPHHIQRNSSRTAELDDYVLWRWIWAKDQFGWFVSWLWFAIFAAYLFCMRNSGQVFLGTLINTNVAIKVLATESGVTPSSTVCCSYHFASNISHNVLNLYQAFDGDCRKLFSSSIAILSLRWFCALCACLPSPMFE